MAFESGPINVMPESSAFLAKTSLRAAAFDSAPKAYDRFFSVFSDIGFGQLKGGLVLEKRRRFLVLERLLELVDGFVIPLLAQKQLAEFMSSSMRRLPT